MEERYRLDERIGLSREESAAYVGVGVTLFDTLIAEGAMPQPRLLHGRTAWYRPDLDSAFQALPYREPKDQRQPGAKVSNPWDRGKSAA